MGSNAQLEWRRLTEWLETNAPNSHRCLNPPVGRDEIAAAEFRIGQPVPAELVDLLLVNNGVVEPPGSGRSAACFLPGGHRLLSLDELCEQHAILTEVIAGLGQDMYGWWWHPQWIPFARHINADSLVIDNAPSGGQGRIGELCSEDHTNFGRYGSSLTSMMRTMADAVRSGSTIWIYRPQVVEGTLDWEIDQAAVDKSNG
jgi:cell wall assembly regulator SMI1